LTFNASSNDSFSVLLVCHSYPPALGGSEIEAQRMCHALRKRGYRIQVVCAGGDPMPNRKDWIDPNGTPVRIYARHQSGALRDVVFALQVAGMLVKERRNYQFVYFLMQGLHLAVGLPVAHLLRKPIVMKISSSIIINALKKSVSGRLELQWLRQWAQCVMILNEDVRQQAIAEGFSQRQLLWMPNPVDTDEFVPATNTERLKLRSRFSIPATAPVVIYCGRFASVKALPSLLEAFAITLQQQSEAILVLVGDGPLRAELIQQARKLGLTEHNVRFVGRVNATEICGWLKLADIFTLVSYSEGFSCALAEAMSTGLPSVVSDIPANRQLIKDGEHGLLTPVGKSEAISAALLRLMSSAAERDRMGQASRRTIVGNYSVDRVADRYEAMFQEVQLRENRVVRQGRPSESF
jgi:glycosyltransferase involved in cell wall biosynthesis